MNIIIDAERFAKELGIVTDESRKLIGIANQIVDTHPQQAKELIMSLDKIDNNFITPMLKELKEGIKNLMTLRDSPEVNKLLSNQDIQPN